MRGELSPSPDSITFPLISYSYHRTEQPLTSLSYTQRPPPFPRRTRNLHHRHHHPAQRHLLLLPRQALRPTIHHHLPPRARATRATPLQHVRLGHARARVRHPCPAGQLRRLCGPTSAHRSAATTRAREQGEGGRAERARGSGAPAGGGLGTRGSRVAGEDEEAAQGILGGHVGGGGGVGGGGCGGEVWVGAGASSSFSFASGRVGGGGYGDAGGWGCC
jgi:hypothetical protein